VVTTAIPPDAVKPVTADVKETLVARPARAAAMVEDAVDPGMLQNLLALGRFSDLVVA